MIAFSTDTSVASRGVYLLSFLIEGYVDRIIEYARSKGKKSIRRDGAAKRLRQYRRRGVSAGLPRALACAWR